MEDYIGKILGATEKISAFDLLRNMEHADELEARAMAQTAEDSPCALCDHNWSFHASASLQPAPCDAEIEWESSKCHCENNGDYCDYCQTFEWITVDGHTEPFKLCGCTHFTEVR